MCATRELPRGEEAQLWLYGVARRVLANHHSAAVRRGRLGERLRQRLTTVYAADPGAEVPERLAVRAALARLGELDRRRSRPAQTCTGRPDHTRPEGAR